MFGQFMTFPNVPDSLQILPNRISQCSPHYIIDIMVIWWGYTGYSHLPLCARAEMGNICRPPPPPARMPEGITLQNSHERREDSLQSKTSPWRGWVSISSISSISSIYLISSNDMCDRMDQWHPVGPVDLLTCLTCQVAGSSPDETIPEMEEDRWTDWAIAPDRASLCCGWTCQAFSKQVVR